MYNIGIQIRYIFLAIKWQKALRFAHHSYYYDTESGFYYLQSRYYDPAIGRFVNPDGYVITGHGVISLNMFAYCLNSVINWKDPSGTRPLRNQFSYIAIHEFGGAPQVDVAPDNTELALPDVPTIGSVMQSVLSNFEASIGLGMGLCFEVDILGLGADVGAYGNFVSWHWSEDGFKEGQEVSIKITATPILYDYGASYYAFLQNGKVVSKDVWFIINSEKRTVSLIGTSVYLLFGGFSFSVDYDIVGLYEDLGLIKR